MAGYTGQDSADKIVGTKQCGQSQRCVGAPHNVRKERKGNEARKKGTKIERHKERKKERIVAKASHGQRYPMPLCWCM